MTRWETRCVCQTWACGRLNFLSSAAKFIRPKTWLVNVTFYREIFDLLLLSVVDMHMIFNAPVLKSMVGRSDLKHLVSIWVININKPSGYVPQYVAHQVLALRSNGKPHYVLVKDSRLTMLALRCCTSFGNIPSQFLCRWYLADGPYSSFAHSRVLSRLKPPANLSFYRASSLQSLIVFQDVNFVVPLKESNVLYSLFPK